jgi:hypothetical protein
MISNPKEADPLNFQKVMELIRVEKEAESASRKSSGGGGGDGGAAQ